MYGQAHAGLGWAVGVLAPHSDRRLRVWCTAVALLPDIDAVPIVFGYDHYVRWHHTFGHNVFTGLLVTFLALYHLGNRSLGRRLWGTALVAACFASHLLTDMKLSGWELHLFWPLSRAGYQFVPNYGLGDPINTVLVYSLMLAVIPLAWLRGVTPLEIISARLDRIALNGFRRKSLACASCGKACNNACDGCGAPVCLRDGRVSWTFRIRCPACGAA